MTLFMSHPHSSPPTSPPSHHQQFSSQYNNFTPPHSSFLSATTMQSLPQSVAEREELENEICKALIHLSCEKMMSSRSARGGARLHRNLLILHLVRRSRRDIEM